MIKMYVYKNIFNEILSSLVFDCNSSSCSSFFVSMLKAFSKGTILFQLLGFMYFPVDKNQKLCLLKKYLGIWVFSIILFFGVSHFMNSLSATKVNFMSNAWMRFTPEILSSVGIFVALLVIRDYASNRKIENVFAKFEEISKIFSRNLNQNLSYTIPIQRFRKFSVVFWLIFLVTVFIYLLWISLELNSSLYAMIYAVTIIYPFFFLMTRFVRFIFFIILVRFNIKLFERCILNLQHQSYLDCNNMLFMDFKRITMKLNQPIEVMKTLKRIYTLIYKTTEIINDIHGFTNVIVLILIVFSVAVGSSDVFLTIMGDLSFVKLGG